MGDNGDLGHGLGVLLQGGDQRMTHLVVSDQPLFRIGQDGVFLLRTCNNHFKGYQQVVLIHCLAALTNSPQSSFVHKVRQIRTYCAGSSLRDLFQIHILCQLDLPGVDLQGVQTTLQIGAVYNNSPVKTAGTEQCLVQDLRTVGCC